MSLSIEYDFIYLERAGEISIVINKVYNEALSLSANARLDLVEKLISNLNLPSQQEIDRLWAEEVYETITRISKFPDAWPTL